MTTTTRPILPGEPATDAERNARAHMRTILSLWDAFQWANDRRHTCDGLHADTLDLLDECGCERDETDSLPWSVIEERVRELAMEAALSVEVRSAWHVPGCSDTPLNEFRVLLTCGGPHLEMRGEIDACGCAYQPDLYFSEMGLPEQRLRIGAAERSALEWFALQFYFVEG